MARRRPQEPGWDPMELQQFNRAYSHPNDPVDSHAIEMNLPGTPSVPRSVPVDQRSDASSYRSDEDSPHPPHSSEVFRTQTSLLESLPSRQLESAMRAGSSTRKSGKTLRRRKKSQHAPPHGTLRFRGKGGDSAKTLLEAWADADADRADGEAIDDLEREKQLKAMTMNLHEKKELKKALRSKSMKRDAKKITCWKQFKYSSSVRWGHFKDGLAEVAYFLRFWTGHLKKIEGLFGTGVTSYFKFLKWLFLLNIPTFLVVVGFLVVPQLFHRFALAKPPGYHNNQNFTGVELLTGAGWFTDTEMYYGFYTDEMIKVDLSSGLNYDMRFAYLCTTGGYFLFCLIILVHSLSRSYRKNYIEYSGEFNLVYVEKVFAGWDYSITSPSSAKLKQKSIYQQLQEFLAGYRVNRKRRDWSDVCGWYVFRVGTNFFVLALITGSGYLIYYISDAQLVRNDLYIIKEMAMPLCMTGVNYVLPFIFSLVGSFENYEQPSTELYITMVRTMFLKGATLAVLIYFWFRQAQCVDNVMCNPCWETFMGQELYRLMIVDLAFIIVVTLFTEFFRRLVSQLIRKMPHPEFNIGRNTLDLIYSQTLCWVGTYFSPFLVFVNILKLFFTFYLKRVSVTVNCVPSSKPWRAARTHTIFLFFTLLSFILCVVVIACSIIFIKPSQVCGPFRNETSAYAIVLTEIDVLRGTVLWFTLILDFISSVGFMTGLLVTLCVVLFYMRILCHGRKTIVQLLKHQIQMEGKDKVFLLKMLQDVTCAAPNVLKTIYSDAETENTMESARTPDTKTFAKLQQQLGVEHHLMSPDKIKHHLAKENSPRTTPLAERRALLTRQRSRSPSRSPLVQSRLLADNNRNNANGNAMGYNNNNTQNYASQPELHRNGAVPYENRGYARGSEQYSPDGNGAPQWHSHDHLAHDDPQQRRY